MRAKYVVIVTASARGVAERWKSQYYDRNGAWITTANGPSDKLYNQLCALGPSPDIEAVATILGNKSWTHLTCGGCSESVMKAVRIGEYDGKVYCAECISEASEALRT